MGVNGSPEYALTWSIWAMPLGPPICALRASARPTSDSGCTGWPTPQVMDSRGEFGNSKEAREKRLKRGGCANLREIAPLAGWPTPMAGSPETDEYNAAGNNDSSRKIGELVGWPTPRVQCTRHTPMRDNHHSNLEEVSQLAELMPLKVTDAIGGPLLTSSPAPTAARGVLNPEFVRWLMGFPQNWETSNPGCASWRLMQRLLGGLSLSPKLIESALSEVTAMQSFRRSPPSSSAP